MTTERSRSDCCVRFTGCLMEIGRMLFGAISALVCSFACGSSALTAFTLTASDDQVLSRVWMALWAMSLGNLCLDSSSATTVLRLRDDFHVCDLDAVPVDTPSFGDVVNRHAVRYHTTRQQPCFSVGVLVRSESSVPVRMVRTLPAKTPAFLVTDRRWVVIPCFQWSTLTTLKTLVATHHRTILFVTSPVSDIATTDRAFSIFDCGFHAAIVPAY